ncbi:TPA: LytTR family transcriptional regulator DNA-binding domain-containing protein, partial [Clostridioides difficile]|nr:LytTR family transcriptional regulator DNA-binding domain-containing protein [Clostridioides difficile]
MLRHTKNKTFDAICILEKIEKDLNIEELVRCHKSYIINLNYVENIKSNTAILDS